jgi:hypothetical protein
MVLIIVAHGVNAAQTTFPPRTSRGIATTSTTNADASSSSPARDASGNKPA